MVLAFIGVSVVLGLSAVILIRGSSESSGVSSFSIGVLSRAPTPLPPAIAQLPALTQANVDDARLGLDSNGARIFVVPSDNGSVCIVAVLSTNTGGTCGDLQSLTQRPAFVAFPRGGGEVDIAGIAADGFSSASAGDLSTKISGNSFWINGARGVTELTVTGPNGKQSIALPLS
jgi:hypothetical protein